MALEGLRLRGTLRMGRGYWYSREEAAKALDSPGCLDILSREFGITRRRPILMGGTAGGTQGTMEGAKFQCSSYGIWQN